MAPSPAPHDRPSFSSSERPPTTTSPSAQKTAPAPPPQYSSSNAPAQAPRSGSGSPKGAGASASTRKPTPPSASRNAGAPKVLVKKEPSSPDLPSGRHRPRKLDLSKNTNVVSPATARPLTAREGALGIQEVGLACLSPGFVTQDPLMNQQVQRSMTLKEQQRQIIEARLQQQNKGDGNDKDHNGGHFAAKTPGLARKRGAPPGLSIVAPSHEQFANERVIQSAPLGQTFTGRYNPPPHQMTRHIANQPSNLGHTSHIHHVPANQTNNRLPPIADVFGQNLSGHHESSSHSLFPGRDRAPLASPHHPPPPPSGRPREYKSAEEAQVELAGGRPELLPNRSTSSSHNNPAATSTTSSAHHPPPAPAGGGSAMKRRRAEYEEGGSPPLGNGRPAATQPRRGPFGEGRDSPETQEAKKEEFLRLCERAWDLFHS
ncbi:hypothetical protein VTK26DRAFT_5703 [Humicola hyalothermophila]